MLGFSKKDPPKPQAEGWFSRLKGALHKSSAPLAENLAGLFTKKKLDEETLQQLEEILIQADLGPALSRQFTEELCHARFGQDVSGQEVREALAEKIAATLAPFQKAPDFSGHHPFVALMVGVNGSGKTTTLAKLAAQLKDSGKSVLAVAGDTFRAAAVNQLQVWGARVNVPVLAGEPGSDPASLAFKALQQAKEQNTDIVLIDTAGRLHNKADLMAELQKIVRVLKKQDESAPHAIFLVLDATTGQNMLTQAQTFAAMIPVSGLIITKLDGSARGGALVSAAQEVKLPILAIGVGEGISDLQPFQTGAFARLLCGMDELRKP